MTVSTAQLPERPVPSFTKTLNPNRIVDFTACSSCGGFGAPFSYDWNYGDGLQDLGTTSPMRSHSYSMSGHYTASLTARDSMGCPSTTPANSTFDVLPVINSITADLGGDPVAGVGDVIDLELVGDPNRVASVSLDRVGGGFSAPVGLSETPPGSGDYLGSYTVQSGTGQFDVTVTGKLSESGGIRQATKQASENLGIDTVAPSAPLITKDVGLGPGVNYTTANPLVQLTGTTDADSHAILVSGISAAVVSYITGQTAWSVTGTLVTGENTISVQARDLAENPSLARTIKVTLDQVAPVALDDRFSGGTVANVAVDPAAIVFFPQSVLRRPDPFQPAMVNLTKSATPAGPSLGPGIQKVGLFGWDLQPSESFSGYTKVTLHYSDGDLIGLDEGGLTLAYRDSTRNQWRQDGLFIESLDPALNTIVFQTQHFTFFTLAQGAQPQPIPLDRSGTVRWLLVLIIVGGALTAGPQRTRV